MIGVHFKTLVVVQNGIIANTRALERSYKCSRSVIDMQQNDGRRALERYSGRAAERWYFFYFLKMVYASTVKGNKIADDDS